MSDRLALALLDALDDDALDALAERLAPRLVERLGTHKADAERWMTTREAAAYIGRSVAALHKLTAARAIPFEQECPRARCYFKRSDLDAWMRAQGASTPLPHD